MDELIKTLSRAKVGFGHFRISIEKNGETLSRVTTNTMAIDAAFDEMYDDDDNSGRYYESRREAQEELVNEILLK